MDIDVDYIPINDLPFIRCISFLLYRVCRTTYAWGANNGIDCDKKQQTHRLLTFGNRKYNKLRGRITRNLVWKWITPA